LKNVHDLSSPTRIVRAGLSEMKVTDLMPKSLESGRKGPLLRFPCHHEKFEFYVREGQVAHGVYDWLTGGGAVFQLSGREGGNSQIRGAASTRRENTGLNTRGRLIDGLRLTEETRRGRGGDSEEEEDVLLDS